jgi:hypothetical protein
MSNKIILIHYLNKVQVLLDREKQNRKNDQMINLFENQIDRFRKLINKLQSNPVEPFTPDETWILSELEPFIREIERFESLCLEISQIETNILETLQQEREKNDNLLKLRAMVMFILYRNFFSETEMWSRHPKIPKFRLPENLISGYSPMILLTDRFNVHCLEDYQKEIQMIMDAFNQMKTEISTRIQTISSVNFSEIREQISYLERIIESFNQLEQKIHRECLIDLEQKQAQIAEMKRYLDENTTQKLTLECVEQNYSFPDYVYLRGQLENKYKILTSN